MRVFALSSPILALVLHLGSSAQEASPQEKATPGPTAEPLTDETLSTLLENLGYEHRKLNKGYLVVVKQDTWTINTQIVLSPNKSRLGFNANLGSVENPQAVSAAQWMDLLVSNGDIDPSLFYFDKEKKKLYLHRTILNFGVTAAVLKKELDFFMSDIRKTESLWKFTK